MKKMFMMLLVLFSFYFGLQYIFKYVGKGHHMEYTFKVDNMNFNIEEILTTNRKNETDNYYFEIKFNNQVINFQLFDTSNRKEKIIKDIKYYQDDNYSCILPIFEKNQAKTDVLCLYNNVIYNYSTLLYKNTNLDNWVKTLENYNINDRKDNLENPNTSSILTTYNNIQPNHYIMFSDYKGIILANNYIPSKTRKIKIFSNDVYNRDIEAVIGSKYVVANYEEQYQFNTFIVIDIVTGKIDKIESQNLISLDSYIQGIIEEEMYLIDKDNKNQYKLNVDKLTITEIGDENSGAHHLDKGFWTTRNINELIKNKETFTQKETTDYIDGGYLKIEKLGNVYSGYYYLYKKNGNKYDLYRVSVQNKELKTYLLSTTSLDSVVYVKDSIYYEDETKIKCYSDIYGIKTIIQSNELKYNKNLIYHVYYKD